MTHREVLPQASSHRRVSAPRGMRGMRAIWLLAIVGSTIALSLGSGFFVPLTLGLILAAVLHPIVATLRRVHVPQALGAAAAVLFALVILVLAIVFLNASLRTVRGEIPKTLMTARRRLESLGIPLPEAAPSNTTTTPTTNTTPAQQRTDESGGPTPGIGQTVARAFGITATALFGLVEILLLAFFLLAAGDAWQEKIRRAAGSSERADNTLATVLDVRRVVLRYLLVNVLINAAQGAVVAVVVWILGYPSPSLWGLLTFIAEFIPYFGGAAMVGLLLLTGIAAGHGFAHALVAPIAYLLITTLQNNLVSPAAYGRSLRLNPTAILAGVMFWGVVWGIAGVFLAVPILAAMRIIAEKADALAPLAVFLAD